MKRILVTGAGGQLGRTLQDMAAAYKEMSFVFLDRASLDIADRDQVLQVFREFQPHYCVNSAAYTKVDAAEEYPDQAWQVNVTGVENLVEACRVEGSILIHISTDYVFDGTKEDGYLPGDPPNPINVYGKTKWEGEKRIQKGLDRYFIIRTSWLYSKVYGPNFYLTILNKAREGESLTVTDSQRGCPTDTANLGRYILEIIRTGRSDFGIHHFTDGKVMTWFGFARNIMVENNMTRHLKNLTSGEFHTLAKRPGFSVLINK